MQTLTSQKKENLMRRLPSLALQTLALLLGSTHAFAQPSFGGLLDDALNKTKIARDTPKAVVNPQPGQTELLGGQHKSQSRASSSVASSPDGFVADPRYSFSADGSEVTDRTTGIVWRRCAEGMSWTGSTCSGQAQPFYGLSRVLAYEKSARGWRVPKIEELVTIARLHLKHENSKVGAGGSDAVAFPGLPAESFWSSTLYYKDRGDRDRTKIVHFANGGEGFRDNGDIGFLLLVKTSGSRTQAADTDSKRVAVVPKEDKFVTTGAARARFEVSRDGREVVDTTTGLIWRRCAEGMTASSGGCGGKATTFDFAGAEARASAQAKSTRTTWRLPDMEELRGIADEKRLRVAVDTAAFPATPPDHFWTSHRTDPRTIYAVNFYNGLHYERYYSSQHYVRLVRDN
jgi:Protein of unknown function (DUF1566)